MDTKDVGDRLPYITSVLFLYACEFNPGRSAQHIQGKGTHQGKNLPTHATLFICRAVLHSAHRRCSQAVRERSVEVAGPGQRNTELKALSSGGSASGEHSGLALAASGELG